MRIYTGKVISSRLNQLFFYDDKIQNFILSRENNKYIDDKFLMKD